MANVIRLQVSGSPEQVRAAVEGALRPEGFRLTWESPGHGIIEKGSRAKAMLLGALATHYKYRVVLQAQQGGTVLVDVNLATTGVSGGAAGVAKVRRKLDEVDQILTTTFLSTGTLIRA